mgnify:CR=1 FL=1
MAARRGGLGKGLDSLIPETIKPAPQEKTKVVEKIVEKVVEKPVEQKVKLSKIGPREDQPRKQFDEDSLAELAESIKQFGVIQPLVVQEKNGFYEIIAGERRWRAAKMAGLKEVPVIIKKYTDLEIMEISLIEHPERKPEPHRGSFSLQKTVERISSEAGRSGGAGIQKSCCCHQLHASSEAG